MISSTKMKAAAGISGVAAILALTAGSAFAASGTGNETITAPVTVPVGTSVGANPYTPTVDSNANPVDSDITITGSGYNNAFSVYAMVCDGKSPSAPGWSPGTDCDNLTEAGPFPVGQEGVGSGNIKFFADQPGFAVGVFRGESPSDLFNCLAPNDDPNATSVSVPNLPADGTAAPIDPTVPSWGSTKTLAQGIGGGSAPCTVRISYSPTVFDSASDKFFPVSLPQDATLTSGGGNPNPSVPESPLAIALPIGGVVLFGAAGALLYRKRRSNTAA